MAQGGIYRFDPPPVQPGPGVPIPAQGQQPPFIGRSLVALAALVGSWEPGPPAPTIPQRRYLAPLSLVYGDQPPPATSRVGPVIVDSWRQADSPQQQRPGIAAINYAPSQPPFVRLPSWLFTPEIAQFPVQRPAGIAPLTLVYGDQPPLVCGLRDFDLLYPVLGTWEPPPPLPTIPQRQYVAPLTLTYGDRPPPAPHVVNDRTILGQWEPAPPLPWTLPSRVATLSLVYGDQPPQVTGLRDFDLLFPVIQSWEPGPPLPTLPQTRYIAPLSLTYGDQPPVVSGARDVDIFSQIVTTAWQPPDPLPTLPQRRYAAPLTLVYGDQPPAPRSAFAGLWDSPATVQQPRNQIAALIPVVVTAAQPAFTPYPSWIVSAWSSEPFQQPRQVKIAPLTLAYGDQPPPLVRPAIQSPADSVFQQPRNKIAAILPAVSQPPFTQSPPWIVRAWNVDAPITPRPVGIAPLTLPRGDQPPPVTGRQLLMTAILAHQPPAPQPQRDPKSIAPLTLTYGDQPPRQSVSQLMAIIAANATPIPQVQYRLGLVLLTVEIIPPGSAIFYRAGVGSSYLERSGLGSAVLQSDGPGAADIEEK